MMDLLFALALITGGLLVISISKSYVRTIIGVELAILGGIFASIYYGDMTLTAVAAVVGVAETVLLVATLFRIVKEGYA